MGADSNRVVLACPVDLEVPALYGGSLARARAFRPRSFCSDHTSEYNVANRFNTYPLWLQPVLSRFDFWAVRRGPPLAAGPRAA